MRDYSRQTETGHKTQVGRAPAALIHEGTTSPPQLPVPDQMPHHAPASKTQTTPAHSDRTGPASTGSDAAQEGVDGDSWK